ncbi:hypothetical protein ACFYYB_20090 [Streptomyces sp. NPDC002886]
MLDIDGLGKEYVRAFVESGDVTAGRHLRGTRRLLPGRQPTYCGCP